MKNEIELGLISKMMSFLEMFFHNLNNMLNY